MASRIWPGSAGLIVFLLVSTLSAEAQLPRAAATAEQGSAGSQPAGNIESPSSNTRSEQNSDTSNQNNSQNYPPVNTPNIDALASGSINGYADSGNSSDTIATSVFDQLKLNIIAFMQSWEHGPNEQVPEFMANEADINAALTKVLNRPHNRHMSTH